ncbi:hypothetical protein BLNAU_2886 [Blattamonas nauphoetae]|uniref:Uncharacterized protein n=1 Tax=Blattamonas nauphoetae TaxID=2049346 RepID=A0ABQ9YF15_9EUKA|nr:hypothetical protein BLNAU_2886 [Blattamonas nauphoetae]
MTFQFSHKYQTPPRSTLPTSHISTPLSSVVDARSELESSRTRNREMSVTLEAISNESKRDKSKITTMQNEQNFLLSEIQKLKDANHSLTIQLRESEITSRGGRSQLLEYQETIAQLRGDLDAERKKRDMSEIQYLNTLQSIQEKSESEHAQIVEKERLLSKKEKELEEKYSAQYQDATEKLIHTRSLQDQENSLKILDLQRKLEKETADRYSLIATHKREIETQKLEYEEAIHRLQLDHQSEIESLNRETRQKDHDKLANEQSLKQQFEEALNEKNVEIAERIREYQQTLDEKEGLIATLSKKVAQLEDEIHEQSAHFSDLVEREKERMRREADKLVEVSAEDARKKASIEFLKKEEDLRNREEKAEMIQKENDRLIERMAEVMEEMEEKQREHAEEMKRKDEEHQQLVDEQREKWVAQFTKLNESHLAQVEELQAEKEEELRTAREQALYSIKHLENEITRRETEFQNEIQQRAKAQSEMETVLQQELNKQWEAEMKQNEEKWKDYVSQIEEEKKKEEESNFEKIENMKTMNEQLQTKVSELKKELSKEKGEAAAKAREMELVVREKEKYVEKMRARLLAEKEVELQYVEERQSTTEATLKTKIGDLQNHVRLLEETVRQKELIISQLSEQNKSERLLFEQHLQQVKGQAAVEQQLRDDVISELKLQLEDSQNERDVNRQRLQFLSSYSSSLPFHHTPNETPRHSELDEWENTKRQYRDEIREFDDILQRAKGDNDAASTSRQSILSASPSSPLELVLP